MFNFPNSITTKVVKKKKKRSAARVSHFASRSVHAFTDCRQCVFSLRFEVKAQEDFMCPVLSVSDMTACALTMPLSGPHCYGMNVY